MGTMKFRWLALLIGCAGISHVLSAQTVLLLSTGNSTLNASTASGLQNAGFTVTVGSPYHTVTATEFAGIDVVLLFPNANWSAGDMPTTTQTELLAFISNGGGLITAEWTNWKVGAGYLQTLAPALPVVSTTQYTGGSTITYTQVSADAVLNDGLPASFAFTPDNFAGVESLFAAKSGATVLYSSSGGANGAGIVGWDYGSGRVLQISTTVGSNQLADPHFSLLLQNSVQWAAVPEPSTWLLLLTGLAVLCVGMRRRLRR